jgi:hypothetical protein
MKISAWRVHWFGLGLYLFISGVNNMVWGDPLLRYGSDWLAHLIGLLWCLLGTWVWLGGIFLMWLAVSGHMDDR